MGRGRGQRGARPRGEGAEPRGARRKGLGGDTVVGPARGTVSGPTPHSLSGSTGGDFGLELLFRAGLAAPPPGFGRPRPQSAGKGRACALRGPVGRLRGCCGRGRDWVCFSFPFPPFLSLIPETGRCRGRATNGPTHSAPSRVWPRGCPFLSGTHVLKRLRGTHIWPYVPQVKSCCLAI